MANEFKRNEAAARASEAPHLPDEFPEGGEVEMHVSIPLCPGAEDISAESGLALRTIGSDGVLVDGGPEHHAAGDGLNEAHQRAD